MVAQPPEGGADSADARSDRSLSGIKTPGRLALDAAFKTETDLRLGLAENLRQARARNDARDERVERAFKDFAPGAPASNEPERRNHVEPDAAPFDAIDRVMRDRLDALKAAPRRAGITIHAASSLIEWDERDDAAEAHASGTIKLAKLVELLEKRGVASLTTSPAVAACEADRKAQALLDAIPVADPEAVEGPHDGGEDHPRAADHNGTDHDHEKVADFVEKSVAEQMGPATAPEARLEYRLIPNGADNNSKQAHLLETFELRPGPTDVTSYHDFSTLQIAFENVWTQVFDGELEALGRDLYREYVGLVDFLGYDPKNADRPISSLDDLTWLIGEIRRLSQIAQDTLPSGGGGGDVGPVGTNVPKSENHLSKDVEKAVESLPGGRVGAGLATLGISELVLFFLREAENFGKKTALRWDDLVNGRKLDRGDRVVGRVDRDVVDPGQIELVLRTSAYSRKKAVVFQILDEASQKFVNIKGVYNYDPTTQTLNGSDGRPEFYEHAARIDAGDLANGLLEFDSEETPTIGLGRYVLGDLDKIVPAGGRLHLYWTDS